MRLNITKTKRGKWSPEKSEKVFNFLMDNMNGMEMAKLTELLIEHYYINQNCLNLFKEVASKTFVDLNAEDS